MILCTKTPGIAVVQHVLGDAGFISSTVGPILGRRLKVLSFSGGCFRTCGAMFEGPDYEEFGILVPYSLTLGGSNATTKQQVVSSVQGYGGLVVKRRQIHVVQ